jgi:hypothetical protein
VGESWRRAGVAICGRFEFPSRTFAVYAIRLARALLAGGCVSWLDLDINVSPGGISHVYSAAIQGIGCGRTAAVSQAAGVATRTAEASGTASPSITFSKRVTNAEERIATKRTP